MSTRGTRCSQRVFRQRTCRLSKRNAGEIRRGCASPDFFWSDVLYHDDNACSRNFLGLPALTQKELCAGNISASSQAIFPVFRTQQKSNRLAKASKELLEASLSLRERLASPRNNFGSVFRRRIIEHLDR